MQVIEIAEVAERVLAAPPHLGTVRLVCVDGPSGSGKTTFGDRLARAIGRQVGANPLAVFPMRDGPIGVEVIHLDDLYEGWHGLATVADRIVEWLLDPLRAGRVGRYRRYDWGRSEYAEWHSVPATTVVVLEGVGAAARPIRSEAALTVWMDAPTSVRHERGIRRDGEGYAPHWSMWAEQEAAHFAAHTTADHADLVIDTADPTPHDPDTQIVAEWSPPPR